MQGLTLAIIIREAFDSTGWQSPRGRLATVVDAKIGAFEAKSMTPDTLLTPLFAPANPFKQLIDVLTTILLQKAS
jgi:hypothetical protein